MTNHFFISTRIVLSGGPCQDHQRRTSFESVQKDIPQLFGFPLSGSRHEKTACSAMAPVRPRFIKKPGETLYRYTF
jgi:hypothetical protein